MRAGQISKYLAEAGHDVTWWVSNFAHSKKQFEPEDEIRAFMSKQYSVDVQFIPTQPYHNNVSLQRIKSNKQLVQNFKKMASTMAVPDAVFCCYPIPALATACAEYCKTTGARSIADIRDLWPDSMARVFPKILSWPLRASLRAYFKNSIRELFEMSDAITATSPAYQSWLSSYSANAKLVPIPLSYDSTGNNKTGVAGFRSEITKRLERRFEIELVIIGNISNVPRFDLLIDTFRNLKNRNISNVRCTVCGRGPYLEILKNKASNLDIEFLGFCNKDELDVICDNSDIGLLLYPNEADFKLNYPNKFGEYLAYGMPIISSLDGISGELIRERSIGYVVSNDEQMTETIASISKQKGLIEDQQDNCLKAYNDLFNARTSYAKLAAIICDV